MRTMLLVAMTACASGARSPAPSPPKSTSSKPNPSAGSASSATAAATTPTTAAAATTVAANEEPLAWGTRPPKTGPLYPIVDGMCVHGEMWPLKDGAALFSYGNPTGGYSRGGTATLARFVDSGLDTSESLFAAKDANDSKAFAGLAPFNMIGSWPEPLIVYSNDGGGDRTRAYHTIWSHEDQSARGWVTIASHRETGSPDYESPVFFQGHAVFGRRDVVSSSRSVTYRAIRIMKDAPPLANIAALGSAPLQEGSTLYAGDKELYLFGRRLVSDKVVTMLRIWSTDGKVREVAVPGDTNTNTSAGVLTTKPSLLVEISVFSERGGGTTTVTGIQQLVGDKFVPLDDIKIPKGTTKIVGAAFSPNGDLWLLPSPRTVVLRRRAAAGGKVDEMPLPPPTDTSAVKKESSSHWPTSGADLVGVDLDDPWAIGEGGSLVHFEGGSAGSGGKWTLVDLPKAPFSTQGRYRAQLLGMTTKGDLYVNAGYGEKGLGWKTWERYRAILRMKRPSEVVRCNEPAYGVQWDSGHGFMSFPPLADETCTTPFVVLLRTAFGLTMKSPTIVHDKKSDFPSVRESIKATPSLRSSSSSDDVRVTDMVEITAGDQRYLGVKVPTVASGRELIEAAVKRVRIVGEMRPEIVCGSPTKGVERTIRVDPASGKVVQ